MDLFAEQLLNGLGLAGPILLVAVALSSSVSSLRLINVAVGGIYVVTAITAVSWFSPHSSALVLGWLILAPVALMVVLELVLFRPQRRRSRSLVELEQGSFALTAALAAVLTAVASDLTDGRDIALLSGQLDLSLSASLGGVYVDGAALLLLAVALAVAGGWHLMLRRTALGAMFRCVAQDVQLAESIGIRVGRVALLNAVVSGLLLGIASCMILVQARSVGPESAGAVLLLPLAAVLLGGLDNITGAVKAALFFGVVASVVGGYASAPQLADVAVFVLLFAVLLVRPEGLKAVRRAG